jgi:hypothetical protein
MAQNEARKKAQDESRKAMEEQREERKKLTEEAMKRMSESQPTPTQEENDLAKLGIQVEEKQDDKSGETVITRTVVANVPLGPHGYETRSVRSKRAE